MLTVKPKDTQDWRRYLDENGRSRDGIFFGPQDGCCFNFLDYELKHGAPLGLGSKNATRILSELVSMAQNDSRAGDTFWQKSAQVLIGNTLGFLTAAGVTPSMLLAKETIDSSPLFPDQVKDTQWQAQFTCWELLGHARGRANGSHDFKQAFTYWTRDFPLLPEKTRQSIVATFTASVAQHFCSEPMHCMFGGSSNGSPEDISNGSVIVVNLPVLDYHDAGRFATVVWKYCTQFALQGSVNRERPVFIFSDEIHYFFTDHTQLLQTTARSARCAVVHLTQNRSNYLAESSVDAGHNRVSAMAACLKTQILHQCSHDDTRRAFSDAIGKRRITQTKETNSYGQGKPRHGETREPIDNYWVLPDDATRLKTGGKANRYRVTAIVTKAGKCFSNGKPAMLVRFDQRRLERGFWANYTTIAFPKPEQEQ